MFEYLENKFWYNMLKRLTKSSPQKLCLRIVWSVTLCTNGTLSFSKTLNILPNWVFPEFMGTVLFEKLKFCGMS